MRRDLLRNEVARLTALGKNGLSSLSGEFNLTPVALKKIIDGGGVSAGTLLAMSKYFDIEPALFASPEPKLRKRSA
jgi:hypothetical protein